MLLEGGEEGVVDEPNALDERVLVVLRVGEREGEVVDGGQDVLEDFRLGVAVGVLAVAGGALLEVVEVGEEPGVEVLPVGLLRLCGLGLLC